MENRTLRVCVAGATGWTGSAVLKAVLADPQMTLSGAVSRTMAGQRLENIVVMPTVAEALREPADVLVDYTSSTVVMDNTLNALGSGVNVVIGTSGLTADHYRQIDEEAKRQGRGVIASGNFSVTAALVNHFSLLAARLIPQWEIIDYAHAEKIDVPSGTVRELAERLASVRENRVGRSLEDLNGPKEARGARIGSTQVHSVRLPGYVIGFEIIFGMPHERLTIRHDAGTGAEPYVAGTLLAVRRVGQIKGLVRGLDALLFE